jgi:two-component system, chemotaxis family, chemotaxis protein CheY
MSRILVVEDDELLRETLAEVLADVGHEVRVAANGQEALQRLDGWPPDLIILDLMMPLMDAYEFRERQLRHDRASGPNVLVLSASPDVGAAAERLQATAWLAKPFNLGVMLDTVRRLLEPTAG